MPGSVKTHAVFAQALGFFVRLFNQFGDFIILKHTDVSGQVVLTYDDMLLGIVHQSAMLFPEEHELRGSGALDVSKIHMDEDEDDEYVHQEVVDDALIHLTTDQVGADSEDAPVHRRSPQSHARVELQDDQDRDQQIGKLLRNAELRGQRMILLHEQVVLNPLGTLVLVVSLRQPSLVIRNLLARTSCRSGLDEEGHDDTDDAVDEDHDAEEDMQTTYNAHQSTEEWEVDHEARDDEEKHADEVDPVRNDERQRMSLTIVC